MQHEKVAQKAVFWRFGFRDLAFFVSNVAVGLSAVTWVANSGSIALHGSLLVLFTIAACIYRVGPAFVDLGVLAVLCVLSLFAVSIGVWVRAEFPTGSKSHWVHWGTLICSGVLPAVAGFFRKRVSWFAMYAVVLLFVFTLFALLRDDDPSQLALALWTGSALNFLSVAACRHLVSQRRWTLLPLSSLGLVVGALLVYFMSWAVLFFE